MNSSSRMSQSPEVTPETTLPLCSMMVIRVNPPDLATPKGFSHAVAGRAGSSSWPVRPRSTPTGGSSATAWSSSSRRHWAICSLRCGRGGWPQQLASLTVYIVDMDDYRANARAIGGVWRRLVGGQYPAMAGIGVSRLWDVEALVEVQGFAQSCLTGPELITRALRRVPCVMTRILEGRAMDVTFAERRPRTATPSAATACRRRTSGRSSSSTCPSSTTPIG